MINNKLANRFLRMRWPAHLWLNGLINRKKINKEQTQLKFYISIITIDRSVIFIGILRYLFSKKSIFCHLVYLLIMVRIENHTLCYDIIIISKLTFIPLVIDTNFMLCAGSFEMIVIPTVWCSTNNIITLNMLYSLTIKSDVGCIFRIYWVQRQDSHNCLKLSLFYCLL